VIYQRPGQDLFLQDATGGLQVKTRQLDPPVRPGDVVEAIGFADFEQFLPVLQDATFRRVEGASSTPVIKTVTLEELEAGFHHAELIAVRGRLMDRTMHDAALRNPAAQPAHVSLTIQTSNFLFTAEAPLTHPRTELTSIPLGSILELTGVCLLRINRGRTLESGDVGTMQSLQMLLPSVSSVRVLQRPSWLTPRRLGIGLAASSGVLLLAIGWSITVSRKNAALQVLVREKMKAQDELQKAHDELDERVKERTAQLKFEMDARKESEVRFKATLAERTRLAQELHDTTEQSLTGISLQLDTAAKLFEKGSDGATRHLEVARVLMSRSQMELRRSIWDLRSRELEQFDLPNALRVSAREILADTEVEADLTLTGQAHSLSEVAEQNLLRIGREALTNVVKHAHATQVQLGLSYGPETVTLRIQDDGRGFRPAEVPGSREGHFGLLGMSERAKRFHGELRVISAPGSGTCLEVEIPLRTADQPDPTATTAEPHVQI
jgi:signal transduction histidine kinase